MPILVVQGDRDEAVPPASADALGGRPNVTIHHHASPNHVWRDRLGVSHARDVVADVTAWLATTLKAPQSRRVRPRGGRSSRRTDARAQALYVVELVVPPRPVQFVWKNSPRGLSVRS